MANSKSMCRQVLVCREEDNNAQVHRKRKKNPKAAVECNTSYYYISVALTRLPISIWFALKKHTNFTCWDVDRIELCYDMVQQS